MADKPKAAGPRGRFTMRSIGVVRCGAPAGTLFHLPEIQAEEMVSEIDVFPEYRDGLLGIEGYRRLLVVYWFHLRNDGPLVVHPRGDESRPMRGVFATRSQYRPNRIGATVVDLMERRDLLLVVRGLDAWEGSPVLDIKAWDEQAG